MRRTSSASSTGSSTPVVSRQWGSQSEVKAHAQPYQRVQSALRKLRALPQFADYETLVSKPASELPPHLRYSLDVVPSELLLDPISLMRRLFRLGAPLTLVYNAVAAKEGLSQTLQVLTLEEALDIKQVKRAIYRFCESCVQELGLKLEPDLFTISQIFSDSAGELLDPLHTLELLLARLDPAPATTDDGQVSPSTKVATTTTATTTTSSPSSSSNTTAGTTGTVGTAGTAPASAQAAARSVSRSLSSSTSSSQQQDQRSKVVDELLQTERKYVHDLETLLQFHNEMLVLGIPRDTVAKICPGLSKLVEFQRRFLTGCEYQAQEFSGIDQNFGWLFLHMRTEFEVYKTYTLAQKEATQTALSETAALMPLANILEPLYELPATLLKPVQRILRYPLLLKEILKYTPAQWPHYHELQLALAAMHEMMTDVNETQRRAENQFLCHELQDRVKDWKGLELSSMGELLLSGVYPVTSMGEPEQEYNLYLFERVLLCCRDRITSKKTPLTKIRPSVNSSSSAASRNSKTMSLELKGRIYLGYVTSITTTKLHTGGYLLRLGWGFANDASEHGGFDVRLSNEELAQMWESTIQKLASANRVGSSRSSRSNSVTSFSHNGRSSQSSLNQFGRWIGTNVSSIDEDLTPNSQPNGGLSRQPSNFRYSSNGIHFWDESSTAGSSADALRKLSISSASSQHSGSGGSGTSRTSLTLGQQQQTPPLVSPVSNNGVAAIYRNGSSRPSLKTADSSSSLTAPGQRKIRIHIQGDTFLILVPPDLRFEQLSNRVERKLKLCGKMSATEPSDSLIFEYIDEDEDRVRLESDEDLAVAFEAVPNHHELSIYVNN